MVESERDSNNSEEFDLNTELSILVSKNVIPSRLAERLENKLKDKNIKITKEQFQSLIEKIREIIGKYAKTGKSIGVEESTKSVQPSIINKDEDMQKLIETVEKLNERLTFIEKDTINKHRIVTTDEIQVPEGIMDTVHEWKVDPLTEIPRDPENVIVLMRWLQYLIDKCGRPNLTNILEYYVDIGWISQDAKINLIDYSQGITEKERKGETARKHITDLPSKDHIQSFIYIQKLKGIQFDKHFIDRIESEISRITKKSDNYLFK